MRARHDVPVLDTAVRILARRSHSQAELKLKLRRRAYDSVAIEDALSRLGELGYLDDAAFARSLANRRGGERGRRAIAAELAAKGVSREVIQATLAGISDDDEVAAAGRILSRRPDSEPAEKTVARLAHRGFSREVITKAWRMR